MAVPGLRGHLRNTTGGEYTQQSYSAVALGLTSAVGIFTRAFGISDAIQENQLAGRDTLPRELTGSGKLYNAKKIISGGVFAYNAAKNNTWVASRMSTSLAGVANDALLFMGQGNLRRSMQSFTHDFGVKILTAFRANLFAPLGKLDNGNKLKSRRLWLDPANRNSETGAALTTLTTTNMMDIADGNATDKAYDKAGTPTRALPGTLVVLIDFTDADVATSGNYLDYKPITHA
jgi:hypothetical protein